jgi:hypothetical protein
VLFPLSTGGDDVADFDLAVIYDHAIDEQLDQLPPLGEVHLFENWLEALAESLAVAG